MPADRRDDQARRARDRFSSATARRPDKPNTISKVLIGLALVLFVGGGLFFGCIAISVLRSVFTGQPATSPGSAVTVPAINIPFVTPETPEPAVTDAAPAEEAPQWSGSDRINLLLLGVDQRQDQRGEPTRTDTMIILTIDPKAKTAGMLSIPRDLWVPIPDHGENKINTAHFFGEMDRKGGGPELAKKTVELNFGIKIHHYARVDFAGFETLINTLGGITVDVPRPLKDDEYPTEDYGITRVYIPAGLQRMDGQTALRYARSRHADSDFGRTHRQRQVLVAARQEAFRLNLLPKLPSLMGTIRDSVDTDFPLMDMPAFAMLMKDIDSGSMKSATIEGEMVIDVYGDGTILIPQRDKIKKAIDDMFVRATPTPAPATIGIHNGTDQEGLAATVADVLKSRGYKVSDVGNDVRSDHENTVIISYRGKDDPTAQSLAKLLGVSREYIRSNASTDSEVDVMVILGADVEIPKAPPEGSAVSP